MCSERDCANIRLSQGEEAVLAAFKQLEAAIHELHVISAIAEELLDRRLDTQHADRRRDQYIFYMTRDEIETVIFAVSRTESSARALARDYLACFRAGEAS